MATIRAHFDGRAFVPDEPVKLGAGQLVDLTYVVGIGEPPLMELVRLAKSFAPDATWPADGASQSGNDLA